MDPNFVEQREEFRENLTLGLIPALGIFSKPFHIFNHLIKLYNLEGV